MSMSIVIPPSVEPMTAADIAIPLRLDGSTFDAYINGTLIPAFRAKCENLLGRYLTTQTAELVLDAFPSDDVDLWVPDVQSVVSVKYLDVDGVQQTLASTDYALDADSTPCWLLPVTIWPTAGEFANAVRIRYTCGYGPAASDVPNNLKLWITAHVCQALQNPSGLDMSNLKTLPYLDALLDSERVWRVA